MKFISFAAALAFSLPLLDLGSAQAQTIEGSVGASERWGSGWIDLYNVTDFNKGDKLKIRVGGSAERVLLRFLQQGTSPDRPSGIDGGVREVPEDRLLETVLESDHNNIVQISIHGGVNPWGIEPLENNGPATIESIELITR